MKCKVSIIFLFPLLIVGCLGADSNSTSDALNDCTASNDGQEKKVINGWATCHNGRYVMTACQADDGSKVEIGLTVRQRNFVFACVQTGLDANNPIALNPVACLRQKGNQKPQDAILVEPGHRVSDPPFVYECVRIASADPNANSLGLKSVACANSSGDIPDGGTVKLGEFTYTCARESGSLTNTVREVFLQAKGCLYHGKEYLLNDQAIIGSFAYKCRSTAGWPAAVEFAVVGCAYEGRRYDENEKFRTSNADGSNQFIMQCKHLNDSWAARPVGCVQDGNPPLDHDVGDTWIDDGGPGDARLKYVMECRGDAASVQQIPIQCVYQPKPDDPKTAVTINPGCMKKFEKPNALVKCIKGAHPSDGVNSEALYRLILNKVEQDALAAGFKYC